LAEPANRVCVGAIIGAHGVSGQVRIKCFTGRPEDVASFGPVETEDGLRRFTIKVTRGLKDGVAASVSGITDRDAAEGLKGVRLYVPRAALPELPAEDDEYYLADLIGLAVRWVEGTRPEGRIVAVHNFGAGDLIEIELAEDGVKRKTLLVPFERDVVTEVNVVEGHVNVLLPQEVSEEEVNKEDKE